MLVFQRDWFRGVAMPLLGGAMAPFSNTGYTPAVNGRMAQHKLNLTSAVLVQYRDYLSEYYRVTIGKSNL